MQLGYEVLLPIGDKQPYDLVVDKNGLLLKVQCKYTSHKEKSGNYSVSLRITGGNQSFNGAKKYQPGDFDLLFVYTQDGERYEFPSELAVNRNSLTMCDKTKSHKLAHYNPFQIA